MKLFEFPRDRAELESFFRRSASADAEAEAAVREIISRVRRDGDKAVMDYANRFDSAGYKRPADLIIPRERLKAAWESLPAVLRKSLKTAHARILAYHKHQALRGFSYTDPLGCRFEQRVHPLRRVGVYVPGGTAAYPSTVLMDVVPARVAGVEEIVMLTPPPRDKKPAGDPREAALGAAWLAGVHQVVGVGGAHGVAALALGTASLPRVDKIVGPGNKYVALAKRLLYGEIDIDMIAGPSEILILADKTARPDVVAADMLSQAEHDPDAQSIAVLIGDYDLQALLGELCARTAVSPRRGIIEKSLRASGAIIRVPGVAEAVEIANWKAPEHLEIITRNPRAVAKKVRNAGAIFLGPLTAEAIGDYAAGPNHTLPTSGTARFFSPLSVWSFYRTSHVVECSPRALEALAPCVLAIAEAEGLHAHAEAVRLRLTKT